MIDGAQYDLSEFDDHPGGEVFRAAISEDATMLFHTYHHRNTTTARSVLEKYRVKNGSGPIHATTSHSKVFDKIAKAVNQSISDADIQNARKRNPNQGRPHLSH